MYNSVPPIEDSLEKYSQQQFYNLMSWQEFISSALLDLLIAVTSKSIFESIRNFRPSVIFG